ncbi:MULTISPECIES: hypothetical protein [unclassified Dietzia]|uniref:hypothetical protein n=1 Tax=unclassified Dietzia TaxID=2617939 RepID=UPI0012E93404|nr:MULTISPECIES: hypothetical protein [unclassified Dietzia]QGW23511.1 hypothetical protein GJR88_00698 [Dietzia sp. DQ12-45-1b]
MWFTNPREGDWVVVTRPISESGLLPLISRGQRGVVTDARAKGVLTPRVVIRIGTALGSRELRVPVHCLRVSHRGRGTAAFDDRAALWRSVRIGALASITLPLLAFVAFFWWSTGSLDGIVGEILIGIVQQGSDFVEYLITHPIGALAFVGLSWLVGRIAFGKRVL